jgi:hypothetical protein
MRITAHGWSRNAGDTLIFDQQIEKSTWPRSPGPARPRVTNLARKTNEVELTVAPVQLTMGGRYVISVQFTDEDIARLFLEAHPEFRAVLEGIFARPEATTTAAE